MNQLSDFIQVALLGTQREALPELTQDSPLAAIVDQLSDASPEEKLLSISSAVALYEQAGQQPRQLSGLRWTPAPGDEDRPRCRPETGRRLAGILEGRFQELLPELLIALNESGQRVPNQYLPNLLDRGIKTAMLRPVLLPVLGQTGRWLAAQNPVWAYASPEVDHWDGLALQWRDGTPSMRQSLLHQLRIMNPTRGRQLLDSTWKVEPSATRAVLIKFLEISLSIEDEPFLEIALDDRSLMVRRKAAELLARLPDSRLCLRMVKNAGDLLRWTPNRQPVALAVVFPRQISPQMLRDGLTIPKAKNLAQARSSQIIEMLGAIPLRHWSDTWHVTPDAIVAAALDSRWPRTLIRGFTLAAERQEQAVWAKALLTQDGFSPNTIRLVTILSPTDFESVVQKLSTGPRPLAKDSVLPRVLQKWPHQWSEPVVDNWLGHLVEHIRQNTESKAPETTLRTTIRNFGRLCSPALAETVAQQLLPVVTIDSPWWSPVQELVAMLRFRRAMQAEINDSHDQ